jgi:hypothetical protein
MNIIEAIIKASGVTITDPQECIRIASTLFPDGGKGPCALLPASAYADFGPTELRVVLQAYGRYGIPTVELIAFLRTEILLPTIEIGAGRGDLGWHLGVTMTDSYVQWEHPEIALAYFALGVPTTRPPEDRVYKAEARQAIRKFRPRCVVASWVTQLFKEEKHNDTSQAFIYGVDEDFIVRLGVEKYIHIGNESIHGTKDILSYPHRTIQIPGIISRAGDPSKNVIYIWE